MRAGTLRHRVRIQEPTETTPRQWRTVVTVWAKVEPLDMARLQTWLLVTQLEAKASHLVTLRYVGPLHPEARLVLWDERVMEIVQVIDVAERHRETHIAAMQQRVRVA
jgi:head-tail adaptor